MDKAIETKGGRFYIRMGYNGFNLRANNGSGYATAARALAAAKRCGYQPGNREVLGTRPYDVETAWGRKAG